MYNYFRAAGVALVVLASSSAFAQASSTPQIGEIKHKEKKICRQETDTGSIMPHSTCHTKAEWDQIEQVEQANADQYRDVRRNAGGHP
jgi:Spy/CpxP family protein refolding chaperone